MTNDETNPKTECLKALSCAIVGFVIRFSVFLRISSFGFVLPFLILYSGFSSTRVSADE